MDPGIPSLSEFCTSEASQVTEAALDSNTACNFMEFFYACVRISFSSLARKRYPLDNAESSSKEGC